MADFLNILLIQPLADIFEIVYLVLVQVSKSQGLSILGLGMVVNILSLPLYARAEYWQEAERQKRADMAPMVARIKAVFTGNERWMILQAFYRQNNYHPVYSLRSSAGLLLQVPFFIAAYAFLAGLADLQGASFLFIHNLGAPDALLPLGDGHLNLLPLAMTAINIGAALIYTRGHELKEKLQLFAMALLFLVLLYQSPSGLVLYWTFNNLFSLGKNLAMKTKKPLLVLYGALAALALASLPATLFILDISSRKRLLAAGAAIAILLLPALVFAARRLFARLPLDSLAENRNGARVFLWSSLGLILLLGAAVPLSLIASSPQEFSFVGSTAHPLSFVLHSLAQIAGFALVWPLVFRLLAGKRIRSLIDLLLAGLFVAALAGVYLFPGDYGTISRQLRFPDPALLRHGGGFALASLAVCVLGFALPFLASLLKKPAILRSALFIGVLSLGVFALVKGVGVTGAWQAFAARQQEAMAGATTRPDGNTTIDPVYRLGRSGENVMVIMLDRAVSGFIPYMIKERPELAGQLEGFTWYPNCVSFNAHTMLGAPAVFGGWDYHPDAINARPERTLVEKHNEALLMLPRLFAASGREVYASDASWANYQWIPDNKIFDALHGVKAFNLERAHTQAWMREKGFEADAGQRIYRNLSRFALFRAAPPAFRFALYDRGYWWSSVRTDDHFADFIDKYAALDWLDRLFTHDDGEGSFILMVNNTTHESGYLQYPDFVPLPNVTDMGPDFFADEETNKHFHVNMASFLRLGTFFDRMRKEGTWDNTTIVIVADHGAEILLPAFKDFGPEARRMARWNPLLMVKPAGARGPLVRDDTFRANADVPWFASDVLRREGREVVNPETGKPLRLREDEAKDESLRIVDKAIYDPSSQKGSRFDYAEDDIVRVKENIFDPVCWELSE